MKRPEHSAEIIFFPVQAVRASTRSDGEILRAFALALETLSDYGGAYEDFRARLAVARASCASSA
jgi:hypothetical protein